MRARIVMCSLTLCACTQDFSVFEGDASSTDGPASDGAVTDAGADVPIGSLSYACGAGKVSSCAGCTGLPVPCVYCGTGSTLAGVCIAPGMSCAVNAPSGFTECTCSGGNPSSCPEGDQVCRNGSCRTCAESVINTGYPCQGGGKCNPADGGCS